MRVIFIPEGLAVAPETDAEKAEFSVWSELNCNHVFYFDGVGEMAVPGEQLI
jgi:hypothetical protein